MGKLIDLDDLRKFPIRKDHYDNKHGNEHFIFGIETVMEYAEGLPEAVVRCRGCRYWNRIRISDLDDNDFYGKCRQLIYNNEITTTADWFCADVERKADGD